MTKIKNLVDQIEEELEGAKNYAETYLDFKIKNDSTWAGRFKSMAEDELTHAMNLHELAVAEVQKISSVFTPPVEMQDAWERSHKEFIEKTAWIKQILSM